MQQDLIDYINAQRAEAIEFSKQPDCWMGMLPEASDTAYWSERVPSGTPVSYTHLTLPTTPYV